MDFTLGTLTAFKSLIRTFTFADLLDVIIVAALIYGFIKLIRETRAEQLVKGLIILIFAWVLAYQLNFRMLSTILDNFFQFSVIALLVVFQPELRRALEHLGRGKIGDYWSFSDIVGDNKIKEKKIKKVIGTVSNVCEIFSREKVGALIVFERKTKLGDVIDTGTLVKAVPSKEIIANIFYNKAPLHDGAMIIRDGLVYAGGCILPLTKNEDISTSLGTRHRAAIGISENSDAAVVVVSEETGSISMALNGVLTSNHSGETLKSELEALMLQGNKELPLSIKNILSSLRKAKD